MNARELLSLEASGTPLIDFPKDADCYVESVESLLESCIQDLNRVFDGDGVFDKLEDLLGRLYVLDFRSFDALLRLCDYASNHSSDGRVAINATAFILDHGLPTRRSNEAEKELFQRFVFFANCVGIRQNCMSIQRNIVKRSSFLWRQFTFGERGETAARVLELLDKIVDAKTAEEVVGREAIFNSDRDPNGVERFIRANMEISVDDGVMLSSDTAAEQVVIWRESFNVLDKRLVGIFWRGEESWVFERKR